jgi:hypothetical protein
MSQIGARESLCRMHVGAPRRRGTLLQGRDGVARSMRSEG